MNNISGKIARLEGIIKDLANKGMNTVDDWEYWVLVEELRGLQDKQGWQCEDNKGGTI